MSVAHVPYNDVGRTSRPPTRLSKLRHSWRVGHRASPRRTRRSGVISAASTSPLSTEAAARPNSKSRLRITSLRAALIAEILQGAMGLACDGSAGATETLTLERHRPQIERLRTGGDRCELGFLPRLPRLPHAQRRRPR